MLPNLEMRGYTTREVAEVLDLSVYQVRSFARSGFLDPRRGPHNEYRFSFRDIVLLRATRELREAGVHPRTIRRALHRLQEQLPEGRPLSTVTIAASGDRVVVRDREALWEPESGQVHFDFPVAELASRVEPIAARAAASGRDADVVDPDAWYDLGVDLEAVSSGQALEAYRRALELDPEHGDAHANLGRLLHEEGDPAAAEEHYRRALDAEPANPRAAYNLGVALEDQGRKAEAVAVYERALEMDSTYAPAHFNLSRLYEEMGEPRAAIRHLADYKRLREGGR